MDTNLPEDGRYIEDVPDGTYNANDVRHLMARAVAASQLKDLKAYVNARFSDTSAQHAELKASIEGVKVLVQNTMDMVRQQSVIISKTNDALADIHASMPQEGGKPSLMKHFMHHKRVEEAEEAAKGDNRAVRNKIIDYAISAIITGLLFLLYIAKR
jgi:formylmethanofuran dehydrogenase subunit E-like metal-binding protein